LCSHPSLSYICTYTQGPNNNGVHRELTFAGCPTPNDIDVFYLEGFLCDFNFIVKDNGEGLPQWAADANDKNTGVTGVIEFYSLDENSDCTSPPFVPKLGGIYFEDPSVDDEFSWKGKFALFRPSGQISNDPDGFDADGKGGIFVLSGRITFEDDSFTIKEYKGAAPVDVCAALS
jgi:hypothetical protein